ncbi:MAG: hypothetical protein HC837_09695 [Chloroflexaceae bacterium]|nr:hypothetical protein [Chloroflexaceae bacterium]
MELPPEQLLVVVIAFLTLQQRLIAEELKVFEQGRVVQVKCQRLWGIGQMGMCLKDMPIGKHDIGLAQPAFKRCGIAPNVVAAGKWRREQINRLRSNQGHRLVLVQNTGQFPGANPRSGHAVADNIVGDDQ